jgi:hypothetical protein
MGGNHLTIDLALMAKRFEETGKTTEKASEKLLETVKVRRKFYYDWMQPGTVNLIH